MMAEVVTGLVYLTGLLVVGSTLSGIVFDRIEPGRYRDATLGLLFGVLSATSILAAVAIPGGAVVDARMPYLIAAGLFGGPYGALAALPFPFAVRVGEGGTWLIGVASILAGTVLGLLVRFVRARLGQPLNRIAVTWAAAASPLVLIVVAFIPLPLRMLVSNVIIPLAAFNALGTLILGFAVISERTRSDTARSHVDRRGPDRRTQLLPAEAFRSQLLHHWKLHEFFNTPHAYILVSIDDAYALKRSMGDKAYAALHEAVANVVSSHIRDADLATARDADRFAVLLPQSDNQVARAVARRIQDRVRNMVTGPHGAVTVSIGLADVSESLCAGDVEAIAEGALFLANARQSANAIGPAYAETLTPDAVVRENLSPPPSFEDGDGLHADQIAQPHPSAIAAGPLR